jgi:hypothetical protein
MSTETSTEITQAVVNNIERAAKGEHDREAMAQALKELDRGREELRRKIGTVNVAVDLIRHARNQ